MGEIVGAASVVVKTTVDCANRTRFDVVVVDSTSSGEVGPTRNDRREGPSNLIVVIDNSSDGLCSLCVDQKPKCPVCVQQT